MLLTILKNVNVRFLYLAASPIFTHLPDDALYTAIRD
jgi:hypothetical protein